MYSAMYAEWKNESMMWEEAKGVEHSFLRELCKRKEHPL